MRVSGWKLDAAERSALLDRFPPTYPRVIADHVTLSIGSDAEPAAPRSAWIVGRSDDGEGVEAMVVALDGGTARPDGSVFHITWSLGPGRQAVESNAVIARLGYIALEPVEVTLTPAIWP